MTFPTENSFYSQENRRGKVEKQYTVQQAYDDGGLKAGAVRAARLAFRVLSRRKAAEEGAARLARVLSALDLTALGVGSTLGVGVYVLAGDVAKNYAGPAVVLSFLLAAVASVFAGLCYAEFGARVPKAGSAYVYSYVCVGEFIAFIIGWNLILEYIIGAASVVKALSEYLDSLLDKAISSHLQAVMPMDSPHLAKYPDLFAFSVIMAFSVALAFGVKESTKFNNFCTGVNLCVVAFVIISGSFKADTKNWRIPAAEVPHSDKKHFGSGGFAPYGLAGIIKGAAVCFYGFIGFDCVATAGEEARRPQKSIPFAVVASLLVVFLAYCGVSSVLTLMLPYYMQTLLPDNNDEEIEDHHMPSHGTEENGCDIVNLGASGSGTQPEPLSPPPPRNVAAAPAPTPPSPRLTAPYPCRRAQSGVFCRGPRSRVPHSRSGRATPVIRPTSTSGTYLTQIEESRRILSRIETNRVTAEQAHAEALAGIREELATALPRLAAAAERQAAAAERRAAAAERRALIEERRYENEVRGIENFDPNNYPVLQ